MHHLLQLVLFHLWFDIVLKVSIYVCYREGIILIVYVIIVTCS